MKITKLIIACLSILTINIAAADDFSDDLGYLISPPNAVLDFKAVTPQGFTMVNTGTKPIAFIVKFYHYLPGQANTPYAHDKMLVPADQYNFPDFGNNIIYAPKVIALSPQDSILVRFLIRRPQNLSDGTYWVNIAFTMKSEPANLQTLTTPPKGLSTHIGMVFDQISTVYLNNGSGNADSSVVTCQTNKDDSITIHIKNATRYAFSTLFSVYGNDSTMSPIGLSRPFPMLPLSEGDRTYMVGKQKGPYMIKWQLNNKLAEHSLICNS